MGLCAEVLALPLAELAFHTGQFLHLLGDLLAEEDVLVLEELGLGAEFVHLHGVLLAGVLEGGERDVLARDEVLHVLGGVGLLVGREVVVEVDLLDLRRLLLLVARSLLELLVGDDVRPAVVLLVGTRVLLLDLLDQLLDLRVVVLLLLVLLHALPQLLPLGTHLLRQLEHLLLIAAVGLLVRGGVAVLFGDVLVALLQLLDLGRQRLHHFVLAADDFLQGHQFLLL